MQNIKIHPIYKSYGYSLLDDNIYHIQLKRIVKQYLLPSGYTVNTVSDGKFHKSVLSHRFIWECCNNGLIPNGYEIDHIDKMRANNRLVNLRCITISENRKNRDHTNIIKFARIAHTLKRFIKAVNIDTGEVL